MSDNVSKMTDYEQAQRLKTENPNLMNEDSRIRWKREVFQLQAKPVELVDPATGETIFRPRFSLKGTFKDPAPGQKSTFYFQGPKNIEYLNKKGYNQTSIVQALALQVKLMRPNILKCTIYDNAENLEIFKIHSDGTEEFRDRLTEYLTFKKLLKQNSDTHCRMCL